MSANRRIAIAVLAVAASAPASAGHPEGNQGRFQVHGFVSQGFTLTSGNVNVNGTSADGNGSFQYQELGVNGSWQPRADLLVSGQLASVRAGEAVDEYLAVEYALLDWSPLQGSRGRGGLRAGKLRLPIGFYNDTRDAVFTRPSILLPQGIYLETSGARAFGYFSSIGASLYGDLFLGDHALYLEAGAYVPQDLGDTADIAILRADAQGEFEVRRGFMARIMDDWDGGRVRAALSFADTDLKYEASGAFGPGNVFAQDGQLKFQQVVLSLQYNWSKVSITGEYVWRSFTLDELIPANPFGLSTAVDSEPSGAYLQVTWRPTERLSGFVRYDEQIRDAHDRSGTDQAARFRLPAHYFYARDWSLGSRYDLRSDVALWAEFHLVDGTAWVNPLDNPGFERGLADQHWNLFTLMLGYRF